VTARELSTELRARRRAARREVVVMRRELRERVRALRPRDPRRRRRRLLAALAVVLLLLLLALRDCRCDGAPAPPPAAKAGAVVTRTPARLPPPSPPLTGRLERVRRPSFAEPAPGARPWLDDFRLQVAARSPRLSDCFRGSESPGGLRWTCALSATDGSTSDHELEPLRGTVAVSKDQRNCLVRALSSPAYHLRAEAGAPSTPVRVSMVIEF
jgi:hypothetical protein